MPAHSFRAPLAVSLTLSAVCLALAVYMNEADPDLWHRFALGALTLENGALPVSDPFSYMPTRATWIDHEWGCALLFLGIHRLLGDAGLVLLKAILFIGTALACLQLMRPVPRRVLHPGMLFALVTTLALAPGFSSTLRCHGFTLLFFAWWLVWLEEMRQTGRVPWLKIGATMLLWANLHGGFLAGPALIAAYVVGEALNRKRVGAYWGLLALALVVPLINPYGWENITTAVRALGHSRDFMPEWGGIGPDNALDFPAYLVLGIVAVVLILQAARRAPRGWDWTAMLLLSAALIVSARHVRHTMLFAPLAAAFVYPRLTIWARALRKQKGITKRLPFLRLATRALIATLLVIILGAGTWRAATQGLRIGVPNDLYASRAVDFLERNQLNGRLLVPFNWGSYALWKRWPENTVSFDGRYDLIYPPEVIAKLSAWEFGEAEAASLLTDHPPEIILVMRDSWPDNYLRGETSWRLAYEDEEAAVFLPADKSVQNLHPPHEEPFRVKSR